MSWPCCVCPPASADRHRPSEPMLQPSHGRVWPCSPIFSFSSRISKSLYLMLPGCLLPCRSSFMKRHLLLESLFRVYIYVYSTVHLSDLVDSCCCAFYHLHWCLPSSFSPGKQKQNKQANKTLLPSNPLHRCSLLKFHWQTL